MGGGRWYSFDWSCWADGQGRVSRTHSTGSSQAAFCPWTWREGESGYWQGTHTPEGCSRRLLTATGTSSNAKPVGSGALGIFFELPKEGSKLEYIGKTTLGINTADGVKT